MTDDNIIEFPGNRVKEKEEEPKLRMGTLDLLKHSVLYTYMGGELNQEELNHLADVFRLIEAALEEEFPEDE